ncbi:MAG: hypothetical protein COY66_03755 [Candidatus Kerfeldbacteria bacterium CG_4_10_14_0_8_um_filter_42_10]|uniref:Uncharacterized protein n=1 Tax=Candidatus Kerfeldbacteria bacterium CG_4_10_14_0_8_um_filter_42_10 TaxID=2014248 RepID=A0A2M7RJI3_9BACT|nr:MAG: hypothetical protein COY66_03755 [Candidatus Kerfeldbacteria bacterium CG_4_10_14_0_8_um_filter_42_10]
MLKKIGEIIKSKIFYYVLLIVFFMLLLDYFINGHDVIEEKYGIKIWTFTYIFLISEVLFNLGIYLMLKGSGVLKIRIRDLIKFKFSPLYKD